MVGQTITVIYNIDIHIITTVGRTIIVIYNMDNIHGHDRGTYVTVLHK